MESKKYCDCEDECDIVLLLPNDDSIATCKLKPGNRYYKFSLFSEPKIITHYERIYFVVPFKNKDEFKNKYNGQWDSTKKMWYIKDYGRTDLTELKFKRAP